MFGWLYRRLVKGLTSEIENNKDEIQKSIMKVLIPESAESSPALAESVKNQSIISPEYAIQPQLEDFPKREETGDAILDRYYELLNKAKTLAEIKNLQDAIGSRESQLNDMQARSAKIINARKARAIQLGQIPREENQSVASTQSLDINNLAPHAEAIVDEVSQLINGFQSGAGDTFRKMFGGVVSSTIKTHPDMVAKALSRFGDFTKSLNESGQKRQSALPSATAKYITTEGFDATRPDTWNQ